jgi:DNA polymerase I-like protein with 3'-5' exonuclease and polymerase domains
MMLSQLLHAGSKVEPLKRGQTSHSLDSVVERELRLEVDKTYQSGDWGGTLTPEMIEYAARDAEVLVPLYEVLKAKIEEAGLTYVAEIEHRALLAVVWMSSAGVPIDQSYALRSYGVEMSLEEAVLYWKRFFQTYPGLKRWHERERQSWLYSETETRTLTNRRRMDVQRLTDRLNSPVQGTGADSLKLALVLLWGRRDEWPGAVPILVCHDEVVVECDENRGEETKCWLENAMIEGMDVVMNITDDVDVPVVVEARIATSWEEGN